MNVAIPEKAVSAAISRARAPFHFFVRPVITNCSKKATIAGVKVYAYSGHSGHLFRRKPVARSG